MENKEILTKAIERAVNNGWDGGNFADGRSNINTLPNRIFTNALVRLEGDWYWGEYEEVFEENYIPSLIFSHDFAKAFWGSGVFEHMQGNVDFYKIIVEEKYLTVPMEGWQYHLQQMVLEEEPLKYLEKFI